MLKAHREEKALVVWFMSQHRKTPKVENRKNKWNVMGHRDPEDKDQDQKGSRRYNWTILSSIKAVQGLDWALIRGARELTGEEIAVSAHPLNWFGLG